MIKLVIFDVDGTLVKTKTGGTFRKSADDWQFLPGREERCKALRENGVVLALASNQNGVAFPWSSYTEAEMQAELERLGAAIDAAIVAVCYNGPNPKCLPEYFHANDPRRKPNPGMILEILETLKMDKGEALMVGDRSEDEEAALAAGVKFEWAEAYFAAKPDANSAEADAAAITALAENLTAVVAHYDQAGRIAFFERLLRVIPSTTREIISLGLSMGQQLPGMK